MSEQWVELKDRISEQTVWIRGTNWTIQAIPELFNWLTNTLKNKGSLLASMVLWRSLNIHGTFQMQKMCFIVEKCICFIGFILINPSKLLF